MKKALINFLWVMMLFLILVNSTHANLISNSDFTGVSIGFTDFVVDTSSSYDIWLTNGNSTNGGRWQVFNDGNGPTGAGDSWAKHMTNHVPIYQGISGPSPGDYTISLDYIFQTINKPNDVTQSPLASLYIVGLNSGEKFSKFDTSPGPNEGVTLYSNTFAPPAVESWVTDWSDTFTVTDQYDAWAFVVWTNAFLSGEVPVNGLRGIDNAYLASAETAPVPEPATMLLLGSGLLGLAGVGRKKFFKK